MQRLAIVAPLALLLAASPGPFSAAQLDNPGFEIDFGLREHGNMWGAQGEVFGEAYQVFAGADSHPRKAKGGSRMLLINVLPSSWNGIWQQFPWAEKAPFAWKAHVLIQGSDLPVEVSTFMKVEFHDAQGQFLSAVEGVHHREDTRGAWQLDTLRGVTPPGTATIRFVLIAGDAGDGKLYTNRIYWDDASLE